MHVCSDLKIIYLEPYVFNNSQFRDGQQYPIVFSDLNYGGWEDLLVECKLTKIPKLTCSRKKLLQGCCNNGDIRLKDCVKITQMGKSLSCLQSH